MEATPNTRASRHLVYPVFATVQAPVPVLWGLTRNQISQRAARRVLADSWVLVVSTLTFTDDGWSSSLLSLCNAPTRLPR